MGLVLTVTAGLVVWIVLWALGSQGLRRVPARASAIIVVGRVAEDPLRLPARPSQLARRCARAGCACAALARRAARRSRAAAGRGIRDERDAVGNQLTVYSSLPLQGPSAAISEQIVDGEKLALADAGGHVGRFKISYVSLDDSNPASGQWEPGRDRRRTPRRRPQDTSTIAYLGDYDSARHRRVAAADQRRGDPAGQPRPAPTSA